MSGLPHNRFLRQHLASDTSRLRPRRGSSASRRPRPSAAADFTMKIGTATINETQHQFIKFYKDEVEKASGGRIEVQIYPASQLGPIPREIEGVQLGNIQGYVGPVDFFVGVDPRFGVFSTPMLFRDDANAAKTVHDAGDPEGDVRSRRAETHGRHRHAQPRRLRLWRQERDHEALRLQRQEAAHQRHRDGTPEDGEARRHRRRHAALRGGAGARPGHHRRHHFGPVGVCLLQDERSAQSRDGDQRHLHHLDRRPQQAVARYAAAGPAEDRDRQRRRRTGEDATMGSRFHQEAGGRLGRGRRHGAHAVRRRPGANEDAARSGRRRRDQGPAGRARHAANGARRRRRKIDPMRDFMRRGRGGADGGAPRRRRRHAGRKRRHQFRQYHRPLFPLGVAVLGRRGDAVSDDRLRLSRCGAGRMGGPAYPHGCRRLAVAAAGAPRLSSFFPTWSRPRPAWRSRSSPGRS